MSFMVNKYSRSDGIALIGLIIVILLMGLLGGSVLMLITTSVMESLQTMSWSKAFFAAETGISKTKEYMTTNASWYSPLPTNISGMIDSASFTVAISTNTTNVVISSTGVQSDSRWTSQWSPAGGEITRAIVVYKQGTQTGPRYRTSSNLRRLSNELTANSGSTYIQWQRIEANPITNEFLLVIEDNNRRVYAQTYINEVWVSNTQLNTAGMLSSAATRSFDVAYENLSGRGLVVYSINTPNPEYRIWTSNTWSAPATINVGAGGAIQWVRLISRPNTDEIMCLARWRTGSRNYSSAIIWNGSIWTNLTNLEDNCSSQISYETLDGAYSTNSALVVYINGGSTAARRIPKYKVYNAFAGTWSGENSMVSLGNVEPRWIRVEYSPDGTLAYAALLNSGTQLQGAYWNGSVWGVYNTFSNATMEISTRRCFDIAWSSQGNTLMVVYSRQNLNYQSYMLEAGGGSFASYGSMATTDDGQWCVLKADPFTSEFYYMAIDDQSDVNLQRWAGAAWTLFPELENGSALTYLSFDFAFRRDGASTNCWPAR